MRPLIVVAVLAALVLFGPCFPFEGASALTAGAGSIDLSATPREDVRVTADGQIALVLEANPPYDRLLRRVAELGGRVEHAFAHISAVAVTVPADRALELITDTQILAVERQKLMRRAVAPVELPGLGRVEEEALHGFGANALTVPVSPDELNARSPDSKGGVELQTFLGYDIVTGAAEVWEDADFGAGAVVVVVDTGVYPGHPLIGGTVIGGLNLVPAEEEERIDANDDGQADGRAFDWDAIQNHEHGTFVSGLIAGHADLLLPAKSRLAQSLAIHSPESIELLDPKTARMSLMGTAPAASVFAIKVFPYDGGDAPDTRVAEAIDRVISWRRSGELAADVINLSLGGPTLWDGHEVVDRMVDAATAEGITVVVAAGNDGPSLITTGSPANAVKALTVGGTVDPIHTRVGAEQFFPQAPPGFGAIVYPHELQVINFSGRGPTGDDRIKPDITATGFLNFSATLEDTDQDGFNDQPGFGFGAGTSFSTPTVSGAAALLAAYARSIGGNDRAPFIANVLMRAAKPIARFDRVSEVEQGKGFLSLPEALELLAAGEGRRAPSRDRTNRGVASLNLGDRRNVSVSGESRELGPGETFTFILKVQRSASRIQFSFPDVDLSGTQNPIFGDGLAVVIHSAKRGGTGDYVFGAGPLQPGTAFTYPMPEPGNLRVTFAADFTNYGPVSGSFTARAETEPVEFDVRLRGAMPRDGSWEEEIRVPENLAGLGIAMSWKNDWRRWPTANLDLYLLQPDGTLIADGATLRSPELVLLGDPPGGRWRLRVVETDTDVRGREHFRIYAKFFDELPANAAEMLAAVDEDGPGGPGGGPRGAPDSEGNGPLELELLGAAPNPFNPATTIRFEMPGDASAPASVRIFDAGGRLVRTLVDGVLPAGAQAVVWDGRNERGRALGSGIYFYRVDSPAGAASGKLVLAK